MSKNNLEANSSFFLPPRGTDFFGDTTFTEAERTATRIQSGDDDDFGASIGVLWKTNDDKFSFGASYRSAPKFQSYNQFTFGPRVTPTDPLQAERLSSDFDFEVPDLFLVASGSEARAKRRLLRSQAVWIGLGLLLTLGALTVLTVAIGGFCGVALLR